MKRYTSAHIKKGKLYINKKEEFNGAIKTMPDGNYIFCLIKLNDKSNRDLQNQYFAILEEFSLSYGFTKMELHDLVKSELFPQLFDEETSTTELDNKQWNILLLNLESFLILKFENR